VLFVLVRFQLYTGVETEIYYLNYKCQCTQAA
jgi:hypothetical protein